MLKFLLVAVGGISLYAFLHSILAPNALQMLNPTYWLPLSFFGVKHFFIWQIFSYAFIQPISSPGEIINLIFTLYLLYTVGLGIVETKGMRHFLYLFFGSVLAAGICAWGALVYIPGPPLAGPMPALYGILIAWIVLFPEAEMFLLLTFPIKARVLFLFVAGIVLLTGLTDRHYAQFFGYSGGLIFGYLYAVVAWGLHSPFSLLHNLEARLHALSARNARFSKNTTAHLFSKNAKIYDFKSGQAILSDEEFAEACLEKISRLGKRSLTVWERIRLWKISKKRR